MQKNRTKSNIKIGEKLYVSIYGYGINNKPNLEEYKITAINTVSIYAETPNTGYIVKFNKKNLTSSNGIGTHYRAYLYENEYWDIIKKHREIDRITKLMTDEIKKMSLEELNKLEDALQLITNLRPNTFNIK